jgi:hypothetical protein
VSEKRPPGTSKASGENLHGKRIAPVDPLELRGGIPKLTELVVELNIGLSVAGHRGGRTAGTAPTELGRSAVPRIRRSWTARLN